MPRCEILQSVSVCLPELQKNIYIFGVCGNVEAAEVPGRFVVQIFHLYSVHRSLVANTVNLFFIPLKTIDVSLSSSP